MIIFNVEVGNTKPDHLCHMVTGIRDGIRSTLKDESFILVPTRNGVGTVTVANGEGKVVVHNIDKNELVNINYDELLEYINSKRSQSNNQ